jgi:hypothetical protein
MSDSTLRVVFAIVLILHGVGHALALSAVFGVKLSETHSATSWLVTPVLGDALSRVVACLIWLSALVLFVGAGLGLGGWIVPADWWWPLALSASVLSLVGLFIFWNALPFLFPNKLGAIAVNIATLVSPRWLG